MNLYMIVTIDIIRSISLDFIIFFNVVYVVMISLKCDFSISLLFNNNNNNKYNPIFQIN